MPRLKSLYWKLTLAFFLVAFITAALVAVFIRLTSANRLQQFVLDQQRTSLEQGLVRYYTTNGSWAGVDAAWEQIQSRSLPAPNTAPPQGGRPPDGQGRINFLGLADAGGKVIVAVDPNYPAGAALPADILQRGTPLTVDGQPVGTILVASRPPGFNPQEALFLRRTTEAILLATVGALLVALGLGMFLPRQLIRPLQELTRAAQSITRGQLEQQVAVKSGDEIGQLAEAFNHMSQEVARVNQQRRQMTADIAHDLRTPLTVISGYIESMQDGVLKPTPQRLALIYTEIERLQDLVDDLRMLSLVDAGELTLHPQRIAARALLERAAALFQHLAEKRGIEIHVELAGATPDLFVDEARMMQVLGNLISNALRYTPPAGSITLSACGDDARVEICVRDTGEGIDPEELPYVFDRFQRTDKSRHSEKGESGLGLAIVKALVEAQGGSARAESTPGVGTAIHLSFPAGGG